MSTHTAANMAVAIGQIVNVRVEAFTIPMTVKDVKSSYGNIRVEVEPLNGQGKAWIDLSRLVIPSNERHLVNCHA